ncbi:MAG: hypothetical protein NZ455_08810 [Bacteroidia bacterium]|nr:hypothetical protein [Bacteroidia bacterium]
MGRSTVSPQHADLAHASAARRGQGHAQKSKKSIKKISTTHYDSTVNKLIIFCERFRVAKEISH